MKRYYVSAFVLLAAIFIFVLQPMRVEIAGMERRRASLSNDLAEARRAAARMASLNEEMRRLEARLHSMERRLPEEEETEALFQMISEAARLANLTLLSPEKGKGWAQEQDRDFYARIPFTIRVAGSGPDILLFLENLSDLPRLVVIKEVSLHADDKGETMIGAFQAEAYRVTDGS